MAPEKLVDIINQVHSCPYFIASNMELESLLGPIVNSETDEDLVYYNVVCGLKDKHTRCMCRMQPL